MSEALIGRGLQETVLEGVITIDTTNSRVGINTSTPTVPLDVVGDINTSTDYNISGTQVLSATTLGSGVVNSSLTDVGSLTNLTMAGDLNMLTSYSILFAGGGGGAKIEGNVANSGRVGFFTAQGTEGIKLTNGDSMTVEIPLTVNDATTITGDLTVDTTTLFVNSSTHRVGVGTITPSAPLEVEGVVSERVAKFDAVSPVAAYISLTTSGSDRLILGYNASTSLAPANASISAQIFCGSSGDLSISSRTNLNSDIAFFTCGDGATATERMRIEDNGSIGIGTNNPATSAILDLTSTTGALILTRMTTTQRNALTAVDGMLIYNTTDSKLQGYEASGWANLI